LPAQFLKIGFTVNCYTTSWNIKNLTAPIDSEWLYYSKTDSDVDEKVFIFCKNVGKYLLKIWIAGLITKIVIREIFPVKELK
jgi:hypothetical protein